MKKFNLGFASLIIALAIAANAYALDFQTARQQGKVGEKTDGYVAAISPDPEVEKLVAEVNAKRAAAYADISKKNNEPLGKVQAAAAQKIIEKLDAGEYYMAGGKWVKK